MPRYSASRGHRSGRVSSQPVAASTSIYASQHANSRGFAHTGIGRSSRGSPVEASHRVGLGQHLSDQLWAPTLIHPVGDVVAQSRVGKLELLRPTGPLSGTAMRQARVIVTVK